MWIIIFKNTCLGFSAGKLKFRTSSPAVFKSSYVFPFSRWWSLPNRTRREVQLQNHLLNSKWMTSDDNLVKTTEEDALWRSPCCQPTTEPHSTLQTAGNATHNAPHTEALSCGCCTDFKAKQGLPQALYSIQWTLSQWSAHILIYFKKRFLKQSFKLKRISYLIKE